MATTEYVRWLLLRAYVHHSGRRVAAVTGIAPKTLQRLMRGEHAKSPERLAEKLEALVPEHAEYQPPLPASQPSDWHNLMEESSK